MADIELVIKIDKDIAQGIIDGENDAPRNIVRAFQATIADAIKNGTLLPKGHGRLIILSEDAVKKEQIPLSLSSQKWISEVNLSNATVATIEADKESLQNE